MNVRNKKRLGGNRMCKPSEYKLPVAKHLTDDEYKYFLETYAAHNRSMGISERLKYDLSKIIKIKRGNHFLQVYYSNGDWWHYTPNRNWH